MEQLSSARTRQRPPVMAETTRHCLAVISELSCQTPPCRRWARRNPSTLTLKRFDHLPARQSEARCCQHQSSQLLGRGKTMCGVPTCSGGSCTRWMCTCRQQLRQKRSRSAKRVSSPRLIPFVRGDRATTIKPLLVNARRPGISRLNLYSQPRFSHERARVR